MNGKKCCLAATLFAAALMLATSAALAAKEAAVSGPSNKELMQRMDVLQNELQKVQTQADKDHNELLALKGAPGKAGWWENTSISGRMYFDMTSINHKRDGVKQSNSGTSFDIKRFYVGIDHKFDDTFAANITTDFNYVSAEGLTQIYIKKAYLQAKLDDALVLRFGSTDLPWIPFVEDVYGYRYVENTVIDRTKFGTSADWGIHASGKFGGGIVNYAVAVVNGAGYKKPIRTNSVDVEGRVNLSWEGFVLGLGGYDGKLGVAHGTTTFHRANRFDALVAYTSKIFRAGVEYFSATNWTAVTSAASDKADGWSAFGSVKVDEKWGMFGRYDTARPNRRTLTGLKNDYFNAGITYSPAKNVDFSIAYKRDKAKNGFLADSNGTIGGLVQATGSSGTYDEVGIWAQFRW